MGNVVGMPSVQGFKQSLKNTGVGAIGGVVYKLGSGLFGGNNLIGGLIGSGLTGAVVKGQAGETLSTIIGFRMAEDLLSGSSDAAASNQSYMI